MNILIAGGTGFIGRSLARSLLADGHQVWALGRHIPGSPLPQGIQFVKWDGRTASGWGGLINEMDAVVNLAGKSTASWPWTKATKQAFWDSRVQAGGAVAEAIRAAERRPRVLVQSSGINHYGLRGESADESTPPGEDFLARLAVAWEASTQPVEEMGVRRVVIRSAVVLGRDGGLLSLMALPVRMFIGGPFGRGRQAIPWIHILDEVGAIRYLIEDENARGAFNLIAPEPTTNAAFMRGLARALKRPYWFSTPAFLLRLVLGEMSVLILEGRFSRPRALTELGYNFRFPGMREAFSDLFAR